MTDPEKQPAVSLERAPTSQTPDPEVGLLPRPVREVPLSGSAVHAPERPAAQVAPPPQIDPQIAAQMAAGAQQAAPNITIINQNTQHATPMLVVREKSMLVALLLTFFFGPLGMLYSTIPGAIVTFILNLVIGIPTAGLALFLLWPIQMVWTYMAVKNHNSGQLRRAA